MDVKSTLEKTLNKELPVKNKVTFFKTKIKTFQPYDTEILLNQEVIIDDVKDIYKEILNLETNIEYALCLNDNIPNHDEKKSGYRLTYTMYNNLDYIDSKIFFLLKKIMNDLDPDNFKKEISETDFYKPSGIIFMLTFFVFLIFDNPIIQRTSLRYIESVIVIKKEQKTCISFHVDECPSIEEFEKEIKHILALSPVSKFSIKKF